jgi:hypothetical protein
MVQIHVHVDIELNAHDVHLECSLSSKHKSEMKDKKIIVFGSNKTKEPKQDSRQMARLPMLAGS